MICHSELSMRVLESYREENSLSRKYKAYYSYGFYIARKV